MKNFRPISIFFATITTLCTFLPFSNAFGAGNPAQNKKVVVLDAGHGGRFSGAYYDGICEKDINLQVVLKLGALIEKNLPNVKVVYTRTVDMHFSETLGVDLQARANIAHKNNADLFISVHSNAMPNKPEVRGTLTLVMGESAGELNRNENALYANNKEELLDMSDQKTATIVRAYIQNLQYTYGVYSEMMGRFIQDEYSKIGLRNHGVRGQPLKVLYSTDMPSVLTEIGFMSNPAELQYITSEEGQNQIAKALYSAVERYMNALNRSQGNGVAAESTKQSSTKTTAKKATETKPQEAPKAKPAQPKAAPTTPKSEPTQPKATPLQPKATPAPAQTVKRYAIQIMAGNERVALDRINFKSLQGKIWILEYNGNVKYKYCYGDFADRAGAQQHLAEVQKDFPTAYIISYDKQK